MPRTRRVHSAGIVHHVMNRGNRRHRIFTDSADYLAFLAVLEAAREKFAVRLLAFCLMPNHWHLVLWPLRDMEVSAYMRWVSGTHVRRYHRFHGLEGTGHLYQSRYVSVAVQDDAHLLTVMRYVESNPLRAGLVSRAEDWPWSSLGAPAEIASVLLSEGPVRRPAGWLETVNGGEPLPERLSTAVSRGAPFGSDDWTNNFVKVHGLEFTIRPRGRPRRESSGRPVPAGQCPPRR